MNKKIIKDYPRVSQMNQNQRIEIVKDIFSSVTSKYDFLNRLLSLRQDLTWRKKTVMQMRFFKSYKFLDMASAILLCTRHIRATSRQGRTYGCLPPRRTHWLC